MFGGLLYRKRKKIAIGGYKIGGYWLMRYDRHAFSKSLHNIGCVTGNPPNILCLAIWKYIRNTGLQPAEVGAP